MGVGRRFWVVCQHSFDEVRAEAWHVSVAQASRGGVRWLISRDSLLSIDLKVAALDGMILDIEGRRSRCKVPGCFNVFIQQTKTVNISEPSGSKMKQQQPG